MFVLLQLTVNACFLLTSGSVVVCFHELIVAMSTFLVKATLCCHQALQKLFHGTNPKKNKKKRRRRKTKINKLKIQIKINNWALTLRAVSKSDLTLQLPVALLAIPISPSGEMCRTGEARNYATHHHECLLLTLETLQDILTKSINRHAVTCSVTKHTHNLVHQIDW